MLKSLNTSYTVTQSCRSAKDTHIHPLFTIRRNEARQISSPDLYLTWKPENRVFETYVLPAMTDYFDTLSPAVKSEFFNENMKVFYDVTLNSYSNSKI